jgi:RNA polymerase sigma-32 factor
MRTKFDPGDIPERWRNALAHPKFLEPPVERELIRQIQAGTAPQSAFDQLLLAYIPYLAKKSRYFLPRYPWCNFLQLLTAAMCGLWQSLSKYDPDQAKLTTFARHYVEEEIRKEALRTFSPVLRPGQAKKFLYGAKKRNAPHNGNSEPATTRRCPTTSLDTLVPGMGNTTWKDILRDGAPSPEDTCARQEILGKSSPLLREAFKKLTYREEAIFSSRQLLEEPETLEVLARRWKLTRERIRQIEEKAFEKVKKHLVTHKELCPER